MGDDGRIRQSTYYRFLLLNLGSINTVSVVDFAAVIILLIYNAVTSGAAQILHAQFKNVGNV